MRKIYRSIKQFARSIFELSLKYRLNHLGCLTEIATDVFFEYADKIIIDDKVHIGHHCVLRANSADPIQLGKQSSLQENCLLTTNNGSITIGERS